MRLSEKLEQSLKFHRDVFDCLRDNCISFKDVTLHPWQSNGRRSEGFSACIVDGSYNQLHVTNYEHWNSDNLDLQIQKFKKWTSDENHDLPDIQFNHDQYQLAVLCAQMCIVHWFEIDQPDEWYVPGTGYGGMMIADGRLIKASLEICNPLFKRLEEERNKK